MKSTGLKSFMRYLNPNDGPERWGLSLTSLGSTKIPSGSPYPPVDHPKTYSLNANAGRVLQDFQIVYISRGEGSFWSQSSGKLSVKSGSVFILFPGIEHNYSPSDHCGWDEYWVGFKGGLSDELMDSSFHKRHPMISVGNDMDLLTTFQQICDLAANESQRNLGIISAKTLEIIARLERLTLHRILLEPRLEKVMKDACFQLNNELPLYFDFETHAQNKGMSYSSFRRHFKAYTGLAPHQYLLNIKLRKAQYLLCNSSLKVQEIAKACHFGSLYHFSKIFKQALHCSPLQYRKAQPKLE